MSVLILDWTSILYLLKAKVDGWTLAEQEVKAAGWDRSAYAFPRP